MLSLQLSPMHHALAIPNCLCFWHNIPTHAALIPISRPLLTTNLEMLACSISPTCQQQ